MTAALQPSITNATMSISLLDKVILQYASPSAEDLSMPAAAVRAMPRDRSGHDANVLLDPGHAGNTCRNVMSVRRIVRAVLLQQRNPV